MNKLKGMCISCRQIIGKRQFKHAETCPKRKDYPSKTQPASAFHILVEDKYSPEYWLQLLVPCKTSLRQLDKFLRDYWLECCGHLSTFTIANQRYSVQSDLEFPEEKNMNIALEKILELKIKFGYEYDFGSTTELTLRVHCLLSTAVIKNIKVLAQNIAPVFTCANCSKTAISICGICSEQSPKTSQFCKKCSHTHSCGPETILPIVNSPRSGICGYTGE